MIKGYKVGLTSAAMQRQLGVDQPDFGHLTAEMFHPENAPIDTGAFCSPRLSPKSPLCLDATWPVRA